MKKFSISTILTAKTPDLLWGIVHFLRKEAAELNKKVETDGRNYIFMETGSPITFVSHMDTVNKGGNGPVELYVTDTGNIMNKHGVLGADDRAGVYGILEIYRMIRESALQPPNMLFTNFEESGGLGVKEFIKKIKPESVDKWKLMIELDRRGKDHYVTYNGTLPAELSAYLKTKGLSEETGSYSDVCDLTSHFKVPSINMAVGYFSQHSTTESLDMAILVKAIKRCVDIYADEANMPKCVQQERTYQHYSQQPSRTQHSYTTQHSHTTQHNTHQKWNGKNETIADECPGCGCHSKPIFLGQSFNPSSNRWEDKWECEVCSHQWVSERLYKNKTQETANTAPLEYGYFVAPRDRCTCGGILQNYSVYDSTLKEMRVSYKCKACFKTFEGKRITASTEAVCPTCCTNSMIVDEHFIIRYSDDMEVHLKCVLCGHKIRRKVKSKTFDSIYSNFNKKVEDEFNSKNPPKRVKCLKCESEMAFANALGFTVCYACGHVDSEAARVTKKDIIEHGVPIDDIPGHVNVAAQLIEHQSKKASTLELRKKVVDSLSFNCKGCSNMKNCVKAAADYVPRYHAEVCPIVKAGGFTVTGVELFLEAVAPEKSA